MRPTGYVTRSIASTGSNVLGKGLTRRLRPTSEVLLSARLLKAAGFPAVYLADAPPGSACRGDHLPAVTAFSSSSDSRM